MALGGGTYDDLKFVNHGKVETLAGHAVTGHYSRDTIINDGRIAGSVLLYGGNDKVDTQSGRITGTIEGGAGDDMLVTDKAGYKLIEAAGAGFDTVKSTVTYTLPANVEKLVLLGSKNIDGMGTAAGDRLFGNSGDNVLLGYDKDRIVLFNDGVDKIDVSGWKAIASFNDLIDNHASDPAESRSRRGRFHLLKEVYGCRRSGACMTRHTRSTASMKPTSSHRRSQPVNVSTHGTIVGHEFSIFSNQLKRPGGAMPATMPGSQFDSLGRGQEFDGDQPFPEIQHIAQLFDRERGLGGMIFHALGYGQKVEHDRVGHQPDPRHQSRDRFLQGHEAGRSAADRRQVARQAITA